MSFSVSLTLTNKNIKDVFPLVNYSKNIRVRVFGIRRLVTTGERITLKDLMITFEELSEIYFKIIKIKNGKFFITDIM